MKEVLAYTEKFKGHVIKVYKSGSLVRVEVDGENYTGTVQEAKAEISLGAFD